MSATWGEITAHEIASAAGGRQISGSPDALVGGLSTDSRTVVPGHLFLALRGDRYNGHDFVGETVEKGAVGIIVEDADTVPQELLSTGVVVITVSSALEALGDLASWWRKQWGGKVVAITGSNGKSTTKELTASILSLMGKTLKNPGNFNNLIGLPLTVLRVEGDHSTAVLEMGMNRTGEIARLTEIADPDIGVITNVGRAHLEGLGGFDGVVKAKGELLQGMARRATAVLNGDDEQAGRLASLFRGSLVTFGLGEANRVRAGEIKEFKDGMRCFTVYRDDERIPVKIKLAGIHNVANALGAAAVATSMSVPAALIARGLEDFSPLEGRFQLTEVNGGITIIDDTYNANPSSLAAALKTAQELGAKGRGLVVGLGEMMELGEDASQCHFDAGRLIAGTGAGFLVVLGDHGSQVIEGACTAGMESARTRRAVDHADMVDAITANTREGDIVFLKGSRKVALEKVAEVLKRHYGLSKGYKG